jgi:phenylpyruvate tautomerase PptA (4-oxalocrotonate tautomerase family)
MPSSLIEVRRTYGPRDQANLIDTVPGALVAAFKIPEEDRYVRVLTYDAHAMVNGLGPGAPDTYTHVTIDCFAGRTIDAKRQLYREIVERLELLGIPRQDVSILLRESPTENWGSGGQAASDYDLGFTIHV